MYRVASSRFGASVTHRAGRMQGQVVSDDAQRTYLSKVSEYASLHPRSEFRNRTFVLSRFTLTGCEKTWCGDCDWKERTCQATSLTNWMKFLFYR